MPLSITIMNGKIEFIIASPPQLVGNVPQTERKS
jgi:hypothetical protein